MPDASAYPDRRADARVRNRHDDVGVDRGLARQAAAEVGSDLVDALAEDVAVGPREVDVLEHALRDAGRGERLERSQPVRAHDHDLAGLDVAHVGRADQIERAGFGADHPRVAEPADRQRPESVRIADADQPILRHHHERERAAHLRDGVDDGRFGTFFARAREQVDDHFGVAAGLKDRALADQRVAQLAGVDEVAVVADRELTVHAVDDDRLGVEERLSPAVEYRT